MTYSVAWKALERYCAKSLGGFRIPRGDDFGGSFPDVVSNSKALPGTEGIILAECKYSIRNPWVKMFRDIYSGSPMRVKDQNNDLVLCPLDELWKLCSLQYNRVSKTIPKYISSNLGQARGYIDLINKDPLARAILQAKTGLVFSDKVLPIVVLGQKNCSFRLAYTGHADINSFLHNAGKGSRRI